jgi:prophage DNA circulation protein
LSVRAKDAEDAAAAAQKEAHDKIVARVAQAQSAAEEAIKKVDQTVKAASDTTSAKWNGLKAKIAADVDDLKSKVAQRKHDASVKRAANYASCWTKTLLTRSTTPSLLSSRLRWLCSMPSLATSKSKRPSAQPPNLNARLALEAAVKREAEQDWN